MASGRPPMMTPAPRPVPSVSPTTSWQPRAAPKRHSASVAAAPSLTQRTGTPKRASRRSRIGKPSMPGTLPGRLRTPNVASTSPGAATPTPRSPSAPALGDGPVGVRRAAAARRPRRARCRCRARNGRLTSPSARRRRPWPACRRCRSPATSRSRRSPRRSGASPTPARGPRSVARSRSRRARDRHAARVAVPVASGRHRRGRPGRLAHRHRLRHGAHRGVGVVGGREAAAGHERVGGVAHDERAVGDAHDLAIGQVLPARVGSRRDGPRWAPRRARPRRRSAARRARPRASGGSRRRRAGSRARRSARTSHTSEASS